MSTFPSNVDWLIITDNVSDDTKDMILRHVDKDVITHVSVGHGAGTFNLALTEALKLDDNEIVYFLENDYLHVGGADKILLDGFDVGADYVSLYDHPDKYINGDRGGNPFVESGGEITRVMKGDVCHWKLTNSATMTFAAKVKTLRDDEAVLRKHTQGSYPNDFKMFLELRDNGRSLISPLPGASTHGETAWLSPFTDWGKV